MVAQHTSREGKGKIAQLSGPADWSLRNLERGPARGPGLPGSRGEGNRPERTYGAVRLGPVLQPAPHEHPSAFVDGLTQTPAEARMRVKYPEGYKEELEVYTLDGRTCPTPLCA